VKPPHKYLSVTFQNQFDSSYSKCAVTFSVTYETLERHEKLDLYRQEAAGVIFSWQFCRNGWITTTTTDAHSFANCDLNYVTACLWLRRETMLHNARSSLASG